MSCIANQLKGYQLLSQKTIMDTIHKSSCTSSFQVFQPTKGPSTESLPKSTNFKGNMCNAIIVIIISWCIYIIEDCHQVINKKITTITSTPPIYEDSSSCLSISFAKLEVTIKQVLPCTTLQVSFTILGTSNNSSWFLDSAYANHMT